MSMFLNLDLNLLPNSEEILVNQIDLNIPPNVPSEEIPVNEIDLNIPLDVIGEERSANNFDSTGDSLLDANNRDEDDMNTINSGEMQVKKNKNLSNDERQAIYLALLERSVYGKLKRETTTIVASLFAVSTRTVRRIWKQAKNSPNIGVVDVSHKRTKNCGRKRVEIDFARIREIPLKRRTTLLDTACALDISKATLFRRFKEGHIRRHSNAIKPFLKEENKKARLRFCISMLEQSSLPHDPKFVDMYNMVHIDEKWFYLTKKSEKYYLHPGEDDPLRTCKSKNFIGKVMFLAAIARPRFDAQGNEIFNGKIGLFPFTTKEPALRTSSNRVAGTMETKAITSVTRDLIKSFLIEKVVPSIRAKWPREDSTRAIFIQQDNARTHVNPKDLEFCHAASQDGFDIRIICQPANSPDLNVLDLGFFNSIQSLQYKEAPKTIDELVSGVQNAFEAYPLMKSNNIFLSLQMSMVEIMKMQGSNKFKTPHMGKAVLENLGQLPRQLKCNPELVKDVLCQLGENVLLQSE